MLSSTVNGILAQRLVRKLCPACKEKYTPSAAVVEEMRLRRFQPEGDIVLHRPAGCHACNGLGYRGRMAIIEFLVMTDSIRKLIMAHEEAGEIQRLAIKEGMLTMYDDGLIKALQGLTTLEEILRVTTEA